MLTCLRFEKILDLYHHFQPFTIHRWMKTSPILSVSSNLHPLDYTQSFQFISPSPTRSILLSFTSSLPFILLAMCHFNFFTRSAMVMLLTHVFLLRSLLVIPSIHLSMLLCVHWVLRSILEFSIQVSHPYVITGSTHWSSVEIFRKLNIVQF
jgi:hypothetical protein